MHSSTWFLENAELAAAGRMRGNGEAKKRERRRGVVATRLVGHKRHESGKNMDAADDAPSSLHDPTCRKSPLDCVRTDGSPVDRLMFWTAAVKLVLTRSATLRREDFSTSSFPTEIFNWALRSWGQRERGPGWKINCPGMEGLGSPKAQLQVAGSL